MTDLSEALAACEAVLTQLGEADALGLLGILVNRAINQRPPEQRMQTVNAWTDTLLASVELSLPQ
jgi:hypothetical protein